MNGEAVLTRESGYATIAPVQRKPEVAKKSWVQKYSGIISLPENFDLKKFKEERLSEKYENLD